MITVACLGVFPLVVVLALALPKYRWLAVTPALGLIAAGELGLGRRPATPGDDLPDFGPALVVIAGVYALGIALVALAAGAFVRRRVMR